MRSITIIAILALATAITHSTVFHPSCSTDQDCINEFNEYYQCIENACIHEPLVPLNSRKALGMVLIIVISALANAGGIGGGAVIVPLYMYMFYYSVGEAIPLSKATIFAGALVNIFLIINKRDPKDPNKLIIDMQIASIIVPLILSGTVIGVALTKLLPPLIILCVLLYYLVTTTKAMYTKARDVYTKETAEKERQTAKKIFELTIASGPDTDSKTTQGIATDNSSILDKSVDTNSPVLKIENRTENASFGALICKFKFNLFLCVFALVAIFVSTLLRGGKGFDSIIGLDTCSLGSWGLLAMTQTLCILLGVLSFVKDRNLTDPGKTEQEIDESIRGKKVLLVKSYFAGIMAGSLGMGGGVIINPVLIKMGYRPEIAAAISGFVVLFTSSSTTSQFLVAGAFDFRNALTILIVSGIGSFLGSFYINRVIGKYNRPSLLIWILFALLVLSGMTLAPIGFMQIMKQNHIFQFNSPC
jgi:uncharacterized membrane protein YfcA